MQATPRALRAASEADSEPRAERAAGPRERAVPARISPAPVFLLFRSGIPRASGPKPRSPLALARGAPAFSKFGPRSTGRNASTRLNPSLWPSFWRTPAPVRAAPNPLPPRLRMRIRSRERSGARAPRERAVPSRDFPLALSRSARGLTPPSRPESPQLSTKSAPVDGGVCPLAPEATARAARPEPSPATRFSATPTASPTQNTSEASPKTRISPCTCAGLPHSRNSRHAPPGGTRAHA